MKILVLGNQGRSVANFWTVLMRQAKAAGHDVVCCVPGGDPEADAAIAALGVPMRHYALERKGLNPVSDARSFRELRRLFREERPDLLFTSTIKPVIYGCLAARAAGVPHVYATITGLGYAFESDSFFKKCIHALSVLLYRTALRRAEGVFFQNRDDIAVFRRDGIIDGSTRVLTARGTGVDVRRFAAAPLPKLPPEGPVAFLLVGRLLEAKGIAEYAEAARILKRKWPDASFRLLGPKESGLGGVSDGDLARWQRENGIEYLGETRDVRPYVAACHVLVLPSWREGTPTSVMEAMSMGRPAVVTDVPGCREVVRDGENGRMCPARDPGALASAMEHFLEHPEDIARMGAKGRILAENEFDAEKVAGRILADMRVPCPDRDSMSEQGD